MNAVKKFLTRAKVVFTALPTYLTAASAIIIIGRDEIVELLPEAWQGDATTVAITVVAWLGASINIVRRVTPVLEGQVGLLPGPLEGEHIEP